MKLLLDTHAFLWWLVDSDRLAAKAKALIADPANEVVVSAASVWEVTTKHRIGKLADVSDIVHRLPEVIAAEGFGFLPISVHHAARAGLLPGPHRDPFDRMLISQAITDDLVLVSVEALFDQFGVRRMWA